MPDSSNNAATKKDLSDLKEDLLQRLVSKEEFDQKITTLATKEELKQEVAKLATKEELKQEVAKLATRKALEVVANQVAKNTDDIVVIKYDIKELKLEMGQMREEMNEKFNMMMNAFDKIMKGLDAQRAENAAFHHAMLRHENRLDDHDHRIGKLEEAAYA
jgi:Fe-S cluster assembly scaffold protein SufB